MALSTLTAISPIAEGTEATPATFNTRFTQIDDNFGTVNSSRIFQGTGSPEAVITAGVSTLYLQSDGADGKTLWRKKSGTGNTGWALMLGEDGLLTEGAQSNISSLGTLSANLLFTDATYDIGATGATRPRDAFLSRNLTVGGTATITGATTLLSLAYSGVYSASPGVQQNDLAIGDVSIVRLTPSTSIDITGMVPTRDGQKVTIFNISTTQDIGISNETTSSAAANRIICPVGLQINGREGVDFWYDGASDRWRAVANVV